MVPPKMIFSLLGYLMMNDSSDRYPLHSWHREDHGTGFLLLLLLLKDPFPSIVISLHPFGHSAAEAARALRRRRRRRKRRSGRGLPTVCSATGRRRRTGPLQPGGPSTGAARPAFGSNGNIYIGRQNKQGLNGPAGGDIRIPRSGGHPT